MSSSPRASAAFEPAFSCSASPAGGGVVRVIAHGALDLSTGPQLTETLLAAAEHARLIVLDLRGLSFVDLAGLRAVARADAHADACRVRLVVLPTPRPGGAIFDLLDTRSWLTLVEAPSRRPDGQLLLEEVLTTVDAQPRPPRARPPRTAPTAGSPGRYGSDAASRSSCPSSARMS